MESIYVTPDGKWKLGRLDCTRKLAMNTIEHLKLVNVLCDSDIYPAKPKVTYPAKPKVTYSAKRRVTYIAVSITN